MIEKLLYGEHTNGWVMERTLVTIYDGKIQECKESNWENTVERRNAGERESRSGHGRSMEELVRLWDRKAARSIVDM